MLGPNVPETDVFATDFERHINAHGFSITPDTTIIIGGELSENCVVDTARDFLRTLPQVSRVFLDKEVLLGEAEYVEHGPIPMQTIDVVNERLSKFYLRTRDIGGRYLMVTPA